MDHIDSGLSLNPLILLLGQVTSATLSNLHILIAFTVLFSDEFVDIRAAHHLEISHELWHINAARSIEVN
jgi:hypothetical protein